MPAAPRSRSSWTGKARTPAPAGRRRPPGTPRRCHRCGRSGSRGSGRSASSDDVSATRMADALARPRAHARSTGRSRRRHTPAAPPSDRRLSRSRDCAAGTSGSRSRSRAGRRRPGDRGTASLAVVARPAGAGARRPGRARAHGSPTGRGGSRSPIASSQVELGAERLLPDPFDALVQVVHRCLTPGCRGPQSRPKSELSNT